MSRADVILGREWLHALGSSLQRSYEHNTIMFTTNGKHVLLIGNAMYHRHPLYVQLSSHFWSVVIK